MGVKMVDYFVHGSENSEKTLDEIKENGAFGAGEITF